MAVLESAFITITLLFVPIHQALIELFKLTGAKTRRYWEALAYIVYGPSMAPAQEREWRRSRSQAIAGAFSSFPTTLSTTLRDQWDRGPQARLIQSFLLRAVGDSPVTEISDADIKNVAQIARLVAPPEVRRTSELLEELIRSSPGEPSAVIALLQGLPRTNDKVNALVDVWIGRLGTMQKVSPVLFVVWRNQFVEEFLPGVVRAERELANVMKAAEFRYHRQLHTVSAVLAAVEAAVISWLITPGDRALVEFLVAGAVAFGALILAPRGTKSLLDAVIGIGSRLKG